MLSEPRKALPKKAGGLLTRLASVVATYPDRHCTQVCTCESSNTEHPIHTYTHKKTDTIIIAVGTYQALIRLNHTPTFDP